MKIIDKLIERLNELEGTIRDSNEMKFSLEIKIGMMYQEKYWLEKTIAEYKKEDENHEEKTD